jgi:hypothetical protein
LRGYKGEKKWQKSERQPEFLSSFFEQERLMYRLRTEKPKVVLAIQDTTGLTTDWADLTDLR